MSDGTKRVRSQQNSNRTKTSIKKLIKPDSEIEKTGLIKFKQKSNHFTRAFTPEDFLKQRINAWIT